MSIQKSYPDPNEVFEEDFGFYAIIPAYIRRDKNLEPNAKLLYGEITALTTQKGYCWASNEYLAQLFDVDDRTIRRWLDALEEAGYIEREVYKKGLSTKRNIWIVPKNQKMFARGQNCPPRPGQNCPPGADKNVPLYIRSNNTSNNTSLLSLSPKAELRDFFLSKKQGISPDAKASKNWEADFEKILVLKEKDPDKIRKVIEWVFSDDFWVKPIQSPANLLKNWDQIIMRMNDVKKKKTDEIKILKEKIKSLHGKLIKGYHIAVDENGFTYYPEKGNTHTQIIFGKDVHWVEKTKLFLSKIGVA